MSGDPGVLVLSSSLQFRSRLVSLDMVKWMLSVDLAADYSGIARSTSVSGCKLFAEGGRDCRF